MKHQRDSPLRLLCFTSAAARCFLSLSSSFEFFFSLLGRPAFLLANSHLKRKAEAAEERRGRLVPCDDEAAWRCEPRSQTGFLSSKCNQA